MVPDRIKLQLNWLNLRVRLDFIQVNLDKAACMVFFDLEMILIFDPKSMFWQCRSAPTCSQKGGSNFKAPAKR